MDEGDGIKQTSHYYALSLHDGIAYRENGRILEIKDRRVLYLVFMTRV
jgi:hypothetical protein